MLWSQLSDLGRETDVKTDKEVQLNSGRKEEHLEGSVETGEGGGHLEGWGEGKRDGEWKEGSGKEGWREGRRVDGKEGRID